MRKGAKLWLIQATFLVLTGCIIFAWVMSTLGWDFTKLSTESYVTNTYEIDQTFRDISMKTDTADIIFALSNDGKCRIECYEPENAGHSVSVRDGALTVEWIDKRVFADRIGINFSSPKIAVYLPSSEYASLFIDEDTGDVEISRDFHFENVDISLSTGNVVFRATASDGIRISTTTGDIHVENISTGSLALSVSTGKVTAADVDCAGELTVGVSTGKAHLNDVACKNFTSRGDTGDISLQNVIAAEAFSVQRSTGDVTLNGCDAAAVYIETDTGSVTGSLLTEKIFITHTDTGRINVPNTATGGRCEIRTDTGDIRITIN